MNFTLSTEADDEEQLSVVLVCFRVSDHYFIVPIRLLRVFLNLATGTCWPGSKPAAATKFRFMIKLVSHSWLLCAPVTRLLLYH